MQCHAKIRQIFAFLVGALMIFSLSTPIKAQNTHVPKTYFEIDGNKPVDTPPNGD